MAGQEPSSTTSLVILLGASEWPYVPQFNTGRKNAFLNSAKILRDYFLDKQGFNLPEENLLDLFDSNEPVTNILDQIEDFIEKSIEKCSPPDKIRDILVYFIGHAGFTPIPETKYFLAIQGTQDRRLQLTSLLIENIANSLKAKARFLRRVIILDCCFSGAAAKDFQSADAASTALEQAKQIFKADGSEPSRPQSDCPERGTALLCSSRHDTPSYVTDDGKYTSFTLAFLEALNQSYSRDKISLQEVSDKMSDILHNKYARPEVHSPDQREGDIARLPLFPVKDQTSGEKIDQKFYKFEFIDGKVQCCIVLSESAKKDSIEIESLESIVRSSLEAYGNVDEFHPEPFVITVTEALASPEQYENILLALCKADIIIFDLTNYEPAVMFLLGIRSVVRRGITISSAGGEYVFGKAYDYPFNIKDVNIVSHSKEQLDAGRKFQNDDPTFLIGIRLSEGLKQLRESPYYLDLPAFESVRRLPSTPSNRKLKSYSEQVLVLCPFSQNYQENNWLYLRRKLDIKIRGRIRKTSSSQVAMPNIVRTLDMTSPRLVSQILYEAIRLTSMCLIDWTEWRPNVFFELGVRLAISSIGAICIIEERYKDLIDKLPVEKESEIKDQFQLRDQDYERLKTSLEQCKLLLKLIDPIPYSIASNSDHYFDQIFQYYDNCLDKVESTSTDDCHPNNTYKIIAKHIDIDSDSSFQPVYQELSNSADLLSDPHIDSEGRSSLLYPENQRLTKKAEQEALERRLAAWYYLENRYTKQELLEDKELSQLYEILGNRIASSLLNFGDKEKVLAREIRSKVRGFKNLDSEGDV